jgi:hypothetical protein
LAGPPTPPATVVIVPAGLAAPGRAAAGSPGAALAWPAPTASTPGRMTRRSVLADTVGGYAASLSRWCGSAQSSTGPAGTIRSGLRCGWVV